MAVLAGIAWLRTPTESYLAVAVGATAVAAVLWPRLLLGRRRALLAVVACAVFCAVAIPAQLGLRRLERDWPSVQQRLARDAAEGMRRELEETLRRLDRIAAEALRAPAEERAAFAALSALVDGAGDPAVGLYRNGRAMAWAGDARVPLDALDGEAGATFTPFYLVLHAMRAEGERRAVANVVIHAEAPADRFAASLEERIAPRLGVRGFEYALGDTSGSDGIGVVRHRGRAILSVRPLPLTREEVGLATQQRVRAWGGALIVLALVGWLTAEWRRGVRLRRRMATLGVVIAAIGLAPLAAFSNAAEIFDAAVYYAPLGGPFTANLAALALTAATLLFALLALDRARRRGPRWLGVVGVLVIAGLGPFLLRDIARGIVSPPGGVGVGLWIAWQGALFLSAATVLLAVHAAGRLALGRRHGGLPLWIAPAIAVAATVAAPVLWEAPGRWPAWYPAPWVIAIAALALTRRPRAPLFSAALVAACGAITLVWGATTRARVELAEQDVQALRAPDPYAAALVDRFAQDLGGREPATTRAELLKRYVSSDLAAAGYPMHLATWSAGDSLVAQLDVVPFAERPDDVRRLAAEARATGTSRVMSSDVAPWTESVLAVPHADGTVTTAVVAPRTRLIPPDPFVVLLGIPFGDVEDPPYTMALAEATEAERTPAQPWARRGDELHGDWVFAGLVGPVRAHVAVSLRPLPALVQRGFLLVLLDLAIAGFLWALGAAEEGGLQRWARTRFTRWRRSYRARLTVVLFLFSLAPVLAFALWSYQRLQDDDRQSRALLVGETLRSAAATRALGRLDEIAERVEAPLLLYEGGVLRAASEPLYTVLAPVGRFLRPDVHLGVGVDELPVASRIETIGEAEALFGYRALAVDAPEVGTPVLAAPARAQAALLDRRRRDLGILVLFASALGALGALWLSGEAARALASPIGALREAALSLARGGQEPRLGAAPSAEFAPVYSAFQRMASDLGTSRRALEEAQRRTEAVLRDVASGVVAVDERAAVTLANPRAEALLGTPLPAGASLAAAGHEDVAQRVAVFLAGGGEGEDWSHDVDGRELRARLTRLGAGGAVLTLDDVTELARAQRVLAWGEMARQVAHEIKNPLTPIRLGVQHLRRTYRDGRGDFGTILEQNVERILGEIDRLDEIARAFSRYGTAPAERPPVGTVDVAAICRDVVALEQMGEGAVRWRIEGAEEPAPARAGDEELREVLINLLENARQAGAGEVTLRLSRGDTVDIEVADDGEGIPEEVVAKVFEPHFSTKTSGSGLGLAISRRLVDGWGGSIALRSVRGEGTRVRVTLAKPGATGELSAG